MRRKILILLFVGGCLGIYLLFSMLEVDVDDESLHVTGSKDVENVHVVDGLNQKIAKLKQETVLESNKPNNSKSVPNFPIQSLPFFFPQELDTEFKQFLASDLSLVYKDVESYDFLSVNPPVVLTSGGVRYELHERLEFLGRGRFFPRELGNVYIIETDSGRQVFVSDKTVEDYRIAKSRRDENPEVFKKLDDFIYMMNHLSEGSVNVSSDLFYLYGQAKKYEDDINVSLTQERFKNAYGSYRYKEPSLLDVKKGSEFGDYMQDLGDKFVAKVYVYDERSQLRDGAPYFIYDDGIWKLLIVMPGT